MSTRCQGNRGLLVSFVCESRSLVLLQYLSSVSVITLLFSFLPHLLNSHRLHATKVSQFLQALPIPAPADRPASRMRQNMELFHPVRSCTHLFSESKTQGLCGVMIGFLLCNLLEFSPSPQQEGARNSLCYTYINTCMHAHTNAQIRIHTLHMHMYVHMHPRRNARTHARSLYQYIQYVRYILTRGGRRISSGSSGAAFIQISDQLKRDQRKEGN